MEELNNTLNLLRQYLKGIWIKKRFIIISSWLICPLGFLIISGMPDSYQSSAKVYADTRSMLKPLLRGLAIQTDPDSEIRLIAKTLLSRPNVEEIARETDLDILTNNPKEYDKLIKGLQSGIEIKSTGRQNIYTITYSNGKPEITEKVVSATLNKFVESTLGQSRQDSDTATKFLAVQIQDYVNRLEIAERKLADFKRNYAGMLPGENSGYYSQVNALSKQVEDLDLQIKEKETMLAKVQQRVQAVTTQANGGSTAGIVTEFDSRIDTLQARLDELLIRYTEAHPDVKETRRRLGYLEKLREEDIANAADAAIDGDILSGSMSDNVIVQQLSIQISELEGEIASLNVRKTRFQTELTDLNNKIDILPDIEAKATALNRDYDITKNKYEELLRRKESADLSRKAEESSEDIQFKVIEPPRIPIEPSGSKRAIFYSLVLIFGFGSGLGIAFLITQINPVVSSADQLSKLTGRPILGFVSHIDVDAIKKTNLKRMWVFLASSAVIVCIYLVFMASEIIYKQSLLIKSKAVIELSRNLLGG